MKIAKPSRYTVFKNRCSCIYERACCCNTPPVRAVKYVLCPPFHAVGKRCQTLIRHSMFDNFFLVCIVANTLTLASEHEGMTLDFQFALEWINAILSILFTFETLFKLLGMGVFSFCSDRFNLFDFVIVATSLLELFSACAIGACVPYPELELSNGAELDPLADAGGGAGDSLKIVRTFRLLRVLRVLKLVRYVPSLRRLLNVIARSLASLVWILTLLFLFIIVFAILGQQLFGGRLNDAISGKSALLYNNFDTFQEAVLTTFQLLTGDNWNYVMYEAMVGTGWYTCIYFISWVMVGTFVLLNLLLVIILNSFLEEPASDGGASLMDGRDQAKAEARKASMMFPDLNWPNREEQANHKALSLRNEGESEDDEDDKERDEDYEDGDEMMHPQLLAALGSSAALKIRASARENHDNPTTAYAEEEETESALEALSRFVAMPPPSADSSFKKSPSHDEELSSLAPAEEVSVVCAPKATRYRVDPVRVDPADSTIIVVDATNSNRSVDDSYTSGVIIEARCANAPASEENGLPKCNVSSESGEEGGASFVAEPSPGTGPSQDRREKKYACTWAADAPAQPSISLSNDDDSGAPKPKPPPPRGGKNRRGSIGERLAQRAQLDDVSKGVRSNSANVRKSVRGASSLVGGEIEEMGDAVREKDRISLKKLVKGLFTRSYQDDPMAKTLGLFGPYSPVRRYALNVVCSRTFDRIVVGLIITNAFITAYSYPGGEEGGLPGIEQVAHLVFL